MPSPQDNIYRYAAQPRQKPVRFKGDPPSEEATQKLPGPVRPEMKANPMAAAEPTVLVEPRKPHWRDKLAVRRVTEADLDELLSWGLPRIQEIYPDCTAESVLPMLKLALYGGRCAFFRTESAAGMFVAETTPWNPKLNVYTIFVIGKGVAARAGETVSLAVGNQPVAIYAAGVQWARDIGAYKFRYGEDWPGKKIDYDIEPIAKKLGHDSKSTAYAINLRE